MFAGRVFDTPALKAYFNVFAFENDIYLETLIRHGDISTNQTKYFM